MKNTYDESLKAFVEKHSIARILTSDMENNAYSKTYVGDDNAEFFEITRPAYVKQEIVVKGVTVKVEVKLLEVEYWSTDNSHSNFYYEQY